MSKLDCQRTSFPIHSIKFCLDKLTTLSSLKISYSEALKYIDYIAYYDKPFLSFERLLETYMDYAPFKGFVSFKKSMPLWMGGKIKYSLSYKKGIQKTFFCFKKRGSRDTL